jgi:hypothetical protein
MTRFFRIAAALSALSFASPAAAATFNFSFGSTQGTFDAPVGGGLMSAFSIIVGATLFDTLGLGNEAPVYDPLFNPVTGLFDIEFRGFGQPAASVFNSTASAQCPVGQCVLQLFDTQGGTQAPEFMALNFVTFEQIGFGTYSIDPTPVAAPVPLPAPFATLAAALALIFSVFAVGRGRRVGRVAT